MELTREQFIEKICSYNEKETSFMVESADTGTIYLCLSGCVISFDIESGVDGEITMYKPQTDMEVTIDFAMIERFIENDDGVFCLEMGSGLSDIVIRADN